MRFFLFLGWAVEVIVNGQPREIALGTTVAMLLEQLELEPRRVAVEVNLDLVPRGRHADTRLTDGDCLEVVTLVGGG